MINFALSLAMNFILAPTYIFLLLAEMIDFLLYGSFHTSFVLASHSYLSVCIVGACLPQSTIAENILGEMDVQKNTEKIIFW